MRIGILGAGAMGTALAIQWATRHEIILWDKNNKAATEINDYHTNTMLPGFVLSPEIVATSDSKRLAKCDLIVLALPATVIGQVIGEMPNTDIPLISVSKGMVWRQDRPSMIHEVVAASWQGKFGVLCGGSFAQEIASKLPVELVLATESEQWGQEMIGELGSGSFGIVLSPDVVGIEIASCYKNVVAIAIGIADGLSLGHGARARLVTRAYNEMQSLLLELGGQPDTAQTNAGIGDMIMTSFGDLSRNRTFGKQLGAGIARSQIESELGHVAEGVYSARGLEVLLSGKIHKYPLLHTIYQIVWQDHAVDSVRLV
jgi:glycerol-3-phosphate dehydrogenase (NAD(P)+)